MTEKKVFICDLCGEKYITAEDAIACESRHIDVDRIIKVDRYDIGRRYPYAINVRMKDGTVIKYLKQDIVTE